jgi:hypothetical protein
MKLSVVLDELKLVPRIMGLFCIWWAYDTGLWFKSLTAPTPEQAGYAGALVIALVGVFKYVLEHDTQNRTDK